MMALNILNKNINLSHYSLLEAIKNLQGYYQMANRTLIYHNGFVLLDTHTDIKEKSILEINGNKFYVHKVIRSCLPNYTHTAYAVRIVNDDTGTEINTQE